MLDPLRYTPRRSDRHVSIRAIRREPIDAQKYAAALIELATSQAEAEKASGLTSDAYLALVAECHDELARSGRLSSRNPGDRQHPDCPCPRCTALRSGPHRLGGGAGAAELGA